MKLSKLISKIPLWGGKNHFHVFCCQQKVSSITCKNIPSPPSSNYTTASLLEVTRSCDLGQSMSTAGGLLYTSKWKWPSDTVPKPFRGQPIASFLLPCFGFFCTVFGFIKMQLQSCVKMNYFHCLCSQPQLFSLSNQHAYRSLPAFSSARIVLCLHQPASV